jgi:hypothetical protein
MLSIQVRVAVFSPHLAEVILPYSKFVLPSLRQLPRPVSHEADPLTLHEQAAGEPALRPALDTFTAPRAAPRVSEADRMSIVSAYAAGCSMGKPLGGLAARLTRFAGCSVLPGYHRDMRSQGRRPGHNSETWVTLQQKA